MEVGAVSKKQGGVTLYGFDLGELPEECIASILSFTTPRDACRLALISKVCNSAAKSDLIWERFLPSNLDAIIARSEEGDALLEEFQTKKKLYMRLADRPLLIDGATKSFWLDKSSGSNCLMIGARSLSIEMSDRPRKWRWTSIPESRFPEVAQLIKIRWLGIHGRIKTSMLSPNKLYRAYLVFKTAEDAYGLEVEAVGFVNNSITWPLSLTPEDPDERPPTPPPMVRRSRKWVPSTEYPRERSDGLKELLIGRFFTYQGEEDEVEISVVEEERGNWKRGLIVEGIELRAGRR